jgi:DNA helicase-2/ATP-dependent DNA helicase PcrA
MGPRWRIGARDLAILGRHASDLVRTDFDSKVSIEIALDQIVSAVDRSERISLLDALESVATTTEYAYSATARERMTKLAAELRQLRRFAGESAIDLISRIIRVTGIGIEAMSQVTVTGTTHFDRLAALLDVAGNFRSLDGDASVGAFLNYLHDGERFDKLVDAEVAIREDAVVIMSVHKSKGLEFPIVAIPDLTSGVFPSKPKDRHWPKNAFKLPPDVLSTPQNDRLPVFPGTAGPRGVDYKAYTTAAGELATIDERRLAYVAVTRAETLVIASGSWWGLTQTKPRGPSDFLQAIYSQATQQGPWSDAPEEQAVNPALQNQSFLSWPLGIPNEVFDARVELANQVRSAISSPVSDGDLTHDELIQVAAWDADILALEEQVAINNSDTRTVRLPASLSASQVIALHADQDKFLELLVRPMPRQPSAAADRGTTFHAWVETFFNQRALFEADNLPGSMDDDIYSDEYLENLKAAFRSGPFFDRTPHALELPFSLVVAGRTWRGRMDGLFAGTLEDPHAAGKWLVVDWKTGRPGTANELQLSIYRQAAAKALNVDPEQVQAAFYYVMEQVVDVPERLLSLAELEELL